MSSYTIVIHRAEEGGYWAEVPALEGCFAQGESVEEVTEDARGAVRTHLAVLAEDGQAVPEDEGILVTTVRVETPAVA